MRCAVRQIDQIAVKSIFRDFIGFFENGVILGYSQKLFTVRVFLVPAAKLPRLFAYFINRPAPPIAGIFV